MITLQDLIDRFGEEEIINISDHDRLEVINETVVNRAIDDSVATIESHLNSTGLVFRDDMGNLGYKVQGVVQPTPKGLILKACDIARYYLYENGVTDIVEKRYQEAIDWLLLVQKNPSMLTGTTGNNGTIGDKSGIVVVANEVPNIWR